MNFPQDYPDNHEEKQHSLSYKVIGAAINVYYTLGPGLLESIYESALMIELKGQGIQAENQICFETEYKGQRLNGSYRIDIIVENELILELKSVQKFEPVHYKQLRSYLRLLNKPLGYLINFNVSDFSAGIGWDCVRNDLFDETKSSFSRRISRVEEDNVCSPDFGEQ